MFDFYDSVTEMNENIFCTNASSVVAPIFFLSVKP